MVKWINKFSLVFLIVFLLEINTSCSKNTEITNDDNSKLTINLLDSDKTLIDAVSKYNLASKNIKIEAKIVTDTEELRKKTHLNY